MKPNETLVKLHKDIFMRETEHWKDFPLHATLTQDIAVKFLKYCESLSFREWRGKTDDQLFTYFIENVYNKQP